MLYSAVDIGTNSIRLLICEKVEEKLVPIYSDRVTTRLGDKLIATGSLSVGGKISTLAALARFLKRIKEEPCEQITVFGTSALRVARDGMEFAALLKRQTGQYVDILSEETEAYYSFIGAQKSLPLQNNPLVFDLGGGSCELAWQEDNESFNFKSVKIGAIYITDTFFANDPPTQQEVSLAKTHIHALLGQIPAKRVLVGVGGTATSLAAMALELREYDPLRVHGFELPKETIKRQLAKMLSLNAKSRQELPGIQKDRVKIMPAGALVIACLVEKADVEKVLVSEGDIMLGSLYALTNKHQSGSNCK